MRVMYSLTWRQMKLQKRRTVITILGVIVAVAMIAAVSSFAATFTDLFLRLEEASSGAWHARITNTTAADREKIAQDPRVRDVFVQGSHGAWTLTESRGRIRRLDLFSLDEAGRNVMGVSLISGRYPEKTGELLLSEAAARATGLTAGDALALRLDETEETFTVCGVGRMTPLEGVAAGTGCALIAQPDSTKNGDGLTATLRLYRPDAGIYDWLQALCESIPGAQEYSTHTSLLAFMGVTSSDVMQTTIYLMEAIIMVIILAAAVSLIYNAFAISVTDRAAQFGMLASIGATRRQRRRAVLFEALTIAFIAIPFGLVFGYLGIGITFSVVSGLLGTGFTGAVQADLRLVVSPAAVLLSVGLALVTVLISAWIPARRAARVSPMEAIRKTRDIRLSGKQVKTSRLTRALFGFEGELAAKNLKRNKKRYRVTTFSLAMSLVLFLSAYAFTDYMTSSYTTAMEEVPCNLVLQARPLRPDSRNQYPCRTLDQIEAEALALPCAERAIAFTAYGSVSAVLPEERFAQYPYTRQLRDLMGDSFGLPVQILALDDESLLAYARQTGADPALLQDETAPAAILINGGNLYRNSRFQDVTLLDVTPGDSLSLQVHIPLQNWDGLTEAQTATEEISLSLAAVTQDYPWALPRTLMSPRATLVLSRQTARALLPGACPNLQVAFESDAPEAAETALQQISDAYSLLNGAYTEEEVVALAEQGAYLQVSVSNYDAILRSGRQLTTVINIFVYGFIILLSLVGAANIVGTISTSLMLRKREFAMVKSVGMGPRAFDRMIRCESAFYGLKAVAWGLAGSVLAIFLMWLAVGQSFAQPFRLPLLPMGIGVAGIFLLVAATMAYSVHRIRRDTIVEDLRLE